MKLWNALALIGLPALAWAEAPAAPNITVNVQPSPAPNQYRGQQVLSDSVFGDVGKESTTPATSKSPYSGQERGMGAEPDYNSAQRAEWLSKCEAFRGVDSKAFRDCYNEEKKKTQDALKNSREAVERRQNTPLRNATSVPDLGDTGERAFGGVDSESDENN